MDPARRRAFERNIPRYYLFAFLASLQLWFPIWVTYLLVERELSLTLIAALEAPFWLVVVLAEIPTGAVADRWGRRTSLVIGTVLYAVAIATFGLASGFALLMLSYLGWAVAMTFLSGADAALLFDTLKALGREQEYERCVGRAMALSAAGVLIATFVGGPLAQATSLSVPVVASAGTLTLAAIVALGLTEPPRLEEGSAQISYLQGVRAAIRLVWRVAPIRFLIPFAAVTAAATMATEYLTQPFLLAHGVEVGATFSGLQVPIRLAGMVGALAAFWIVGRLGEGMTIAVVPVLGAIAYAGLWVWDSLGAVSLLALLALARGIARPVVSGYINRRIPSDQRATVLSLHQLAFSLLLVPIVPALGRTADALGIQSGFGLASLILIVLGSATGALWIRAHLRPPEAPVPGDGPAGAAAVGSALSPAADSRPALPESSGGGGHP